MKDIEKLKEYLRRYYQEHKGKWKNYQSQNWKHIKDIRKEYVRKLKLEIYKKYGGKCSNPNCPIPRDKLDIRSLQIDHVHNDGYKELHDKSRYSYLPYLRKVLADIKGNYQLLCPYCNWIKRYRNRESE
jgi:hypothetical protein